MADRSWMSWGRTGKRERGINKESNEGKVYEERMEKKMWRKIEMNETRKR